MKILKSRFTSLWFCLACQHRISCCFVKYNSSVISRYDWLFLPSAREVSPGNRSNYKSTRERVDSKGLYGRWRLHLMGSCCRTKFKSKKGETDKKGGEKNASFESLYILLASNDCTTWLSVWTNGENDVRSFQVASAQQDEFVFTGFLACHWFGIS